MIGTMGRMISDVAARAPQRQAQADMLPEEPGAPHLERVQSLLTARTALARFHMAFALMSVIPLLVCFYLITAKFFSIDVLVGLNGLYLLLAVCIGLLGLVIGRRIVREAIEQLLRLNARYAYLVTELAQREEALTRALSEVRHSNDELQRAHLQLIQAAKMESVGRLAAGVAHEVKNPLATLLIGVEHLSEHFSSTDGQLTGLLHDMTDAVRRADAVIKGLLDFSSPSELNLAPQDLDTTIQWALAFVKHELDRHQIRVIKRLAPSLPPLQVDRSKIEQVFVNLFTNAIDAMPRGGTLEVTAFLHDLGRPRSTGESQEGVPDQLREGRVVMVKIADSGTGIPPDKLPKVFDPFFTTKATGSGTGLGLTVTKKIVELHGGSMLIHNREEGGVQVTLLFTPEKDGAHAQTADLVG